MKRLIAKHPHGSRLYEESAALFRIKCRVTTSLVYRKRSDRYLYLQTRLRIKKRIAEVQNEGKVKVVESGMDCDGVKYTGKIHEIPANADSYEELWDELNGWADGPFCLRLIDEDEAQTTEYQSRDLVAEAFENGHAHILYS